MKRKSADPSSPLPSRSAQRSCSIEQAEKRIQQGHHHLILKALQASQSCSLFFLLFPSLSNVHPGMVWVAHVCAYTIMRKISRFMRVWKVANPDELELEWPPPRVRLLALIQAAFKMRIWLLDYIRASTEDSYPDNKAVPLTDRTSLFPIVVDTVLHDTRKPRTAELLEAPIKDAYWSATLTAYSRVQNQAQAAFLLVTATLSRSTVLVNAIGSFFRTDGKSLNDVESLLQTFDWKRVLCPWKPASKTYDLRTSTLNPQSPDRFVARGLSAVHHILQKATAATTIADLAASLLKIKFYGRFTVQHLLGNLAHLQAERPFFRVDLRSYIDIREMRADEWDWSSVQKYVSLQNTAKNMLRFIKKETPSHINGGWMNPSGVATKQGVRSDMCEAVREGMVEICKTREELLSYELKVRYSGGTGTISLDPWELSLFNILTNACMYQKVVCKQQSIPAQL